MGAQAAQPGSVPSLRGPILIGFIGTILLVLLAGGYAYRATAHSSESADWVVHSQLVRATLGRAYASLADAESAQRSYLLTGLPADKAEYTRFVAQAAADEGALTGLTVGVEQQRRAAELSGLIRQRLTILDQHLQLYEQQGRDAAVSAIAAGDGARAMRAARALVDSMDNAEQHQLAARTDVMVHERRGTFGGIVVLLGVAICAFTILFGRLRGVVGRQAAAEAALRASEEQLAVTLQSIGDAVLTTDAAGRVSRLNAVAELLTGWSEAEAVGRPVGEIFKVISEETRAPAYVPVDDTLARGAVQGLANHTLLIARDGTERSIGDSCAPIRDRRGRVIGAVLIFRDMTAENATRRALREGEAQLRLLNSDLERRVEDRTEQLRHSERRFAALFESAPDALLITDTRGVIAMANNQAVLLFGWTREELIGQSVEKLVPQEARHRHGTLRDAYTHGQAEPGVAGGGRLLKALRRDGTEFEAEISLGVLETEEGRMVAAAVRDVTERVQLEAQLRHSQKLDTIGQLAGGVAHDFNNLVTIINNTVELAGATLSPGDPLIEELATIRDAGSSAAALTQQLLAFSRKQMLLPIIVNLNDVVTKFEPMLKRLIGEHVDVTFVPGENLATVKVDPGQMEQVILNLAVNSRDAMPTGGVLRIETSNVVLDESYARTHQAVQPGPYVMLAVSDTGVGMDEATRLRIFDPFFTTKPAGRGTGLGLSTVYGIIKQSGGDIWVYSEPGRGTTTKVYLPQMAGAVVHVAPLTTTPARGTETLLVVEDNAPLRRIARRICESAGYQVLDAACGEDAVTVLEAHQGPVDLIVTDVVMPGMGVRDLAARVVALRPQAKILYTSGYTGDLTVWHGALDAGAHFISKPYTGQDLKQKIRDVLDS